MVSRLSARALAALGIDLPTINGLLEVERLADEASGGASQIYGIGNPSSFVWNSDPTGVFPAGNPTRDLTMSFYDAENTLVASRTLRGTLTSASGLIAVTNVSSTATTGYSTSYVLIDDGTASVRADITLVQPSGAELKMSLAWTSVDLSVAGGSPASGGSK